MKIKNDVPIIIPGRFKRKDFKPLNNETAKNLFIAFFQNKMTIILLLLQVKNPTPDSLLAMKSIIFFDDLYHHMLRTEDQAELLRVFQWMKLFLKRFPNVKPIQKKKALEYIRLIYRVFGLELKLYF